MTPRQRSPGAAQLREQARQNQTLLATVLAGIVFVRQRVVLAQPPLDRRAAGRRVRLRLWPGAGLPLQPWPARHAPALADRHWALEAQP